MDFGFGGKTFKTTSVDKEELEKTIKKTIKDTLNEDIKEIIYTETGADVMLENDDVVEIEIDWKEFNIVGLKVMEKQ